MKLSRYECDDIRSKKTVYPFIDRVEKKEQIMALCSRMKNSFNLWRQNKWYLNDENTTTAITYRIQHSYDFKYTNSCSLFHQ